MKIRPTIHYLTDAEIASVRKHKIKTYSLPINYRDLHCDNCLYNGDKL